MATKLAVIGGGPGGYVCAIRAAQLGADVTLIEKERLGGTCLNVGCIPTKALLHTAELFDRARTGAGYGVEADVRLNFTQAQTHKAGVVKQLVNGVGGLLRAAKVKTVMGRAAFIDKGALAIETSEGKRSETFDRIVIATGSASVIPPIPGIDNPRCIDSTGALELTEVPARMVIIGGGVIGIELATLYGTLGSRITVVEMMDEILPMMDAELVKRLRSDLAKKGVEIVTRARVVSIAERDGQGVVAVEMSDGTSREMSGDKILVSVGRKPHTDGLNLDAVGIARERGRIVVDDGMETTLPGVYAIGDCNGRIMLAHVASAQGEVAAENALGGKARFDSATNASCVYTDPEFAGVGLTEAQAKEQGRAIRAACFPLQANGKALIENGGQGVVKVVSGAEFGEILGVHIYGPRATDLIAEAALAIGMEATVDELIATIHAHPTLSEALREAVLAVEGRAIHVPGSRK